jgi:aminoglycoside phosphotransferase (APT) family kinase protein
MVGDNFGMTVNGGDELAEVESYLASLTPEERSKALVPEPVPSPPTPEQIAEQRRAEIMTRLHEIDLKTARGGRAVALGRSTEYDLIKLNEYEDEADALRIELRAL